MRLLLSICLSLLMVSPVWAAESNRAMKVDKKQASDWNSFASDLYALHQEQLAGHEVKKKVRHGGYRGKKNFYKEVTYIDAQSGHVLSRIQWENANPENIHVIEVFQYDDNGRVSCDYTAAFLPGYRNAPVQTLVALHSYNQGLHAFRSFDASGEAVFERCDGAYKGKAIDMDFEDDEIDDLRNDPDGIMKTPLYQACFGKLDLTAAEFLPPRQR